MQFINDSGRGFYDKYKVKRIDNSPNHPNCRYFVLDLDHDPHAISAIITYALAVKPSNPKLCQDLLGIAESSAHSQDRYNEEEELDT